MAEVTIRGAGVFGLSIAWACAERGAQVRVIDPHGVAAGASGGIVGALAPHVPENWNPKKQFQLESLLMAEAFWQRVQDVGQRDPGYARLGRLQPVADAAALDLARSRAIQARTLWGDAATWDIVSQSGPWTPASPTGSYIFDTLSARIQPRAACHALQAALTARGIPIETDAADAGKVVWATGIAGLEALNTDHHRLVGTGVKGQAALFQADAQEQPQVFVDGLHIVPHFDGTTAVGSTSERDYADPDATDAQLDPLIEKARACLPALHKAPVIARWAGVRPRSRSRAPMLGQWPGRPGHFIANGGFKIGFGMAPKVAHVMADLVLDDSDTIPEGFRVEDSL